jgi:uncharacterized membrane protein
LSGCAGGLNASLKVHHLRASQIFAIFSRASWILDPFRRLHKAQFMLVPRTTTAIESVVITFLLLVASACIPLILTRKALRRYHEGTHEQE